MLNDNDLATLKDEVSAIIARCLRVNDPIHNDAVGFCAHCYDNAMSVIHEIADADAIGNPEMNAVLAQLFKQIWMSSDALVCLLPPELSAKVNELTESMLNAISPDLLESKRQRHAVLMAGGTIQDAENLTKH